MIPFSIHIRQELKLFDSKGTNSGHSLLIGGALHAFFCCFHPSAASDSKLFLTSSMIWESIVSLVRRSTSSTERIPSLTNSVISMA